MANPRFEIIQTLSGEMTLRDVILQEKFHPAGPIYEAQEIYISQSKLKVKLQQMPLTLFDVGLGAASNSIAAYEAAREVNSKRLTIYSFEFDLEILQFSLENSHQFDHINRHKALLTNLLEKGAYEDAFVDWKVIHGDLLKTIQMDLPAPDLIFHDPYSPLLNPDLWSLKIFERYFELSGGKHCILVTYSQATRARAALLNAGFYVGHGLGLGMKRESTVASTLLADLDKPLDKNWPTKWNRSSHPYPSDLNSSFYTQFAEKINTHKQFTSHL